LQNEGRSENEMENSMLDFKNRISKVVEKYGFGLEKDFFL
jgi:hypothetical protein